jgi:hypothetical protein
LRNCEIAKLEIDGEKIETGNWRLETREDGWTELGEVNLDEGKHKLTLYFGKVPNLLVKKALDRGTRMARIEEWEVDQWYQVRGKLSEDRENNKGKVSIEEKEEGEEDWRRIKEYHLPDGEFVFYFKSGSFSDSGRLILENTNFGDFEYLSVKPVLVPKVVLRSTNELADSRINELRNLPRITFVKVNPTKYKIKVEGAKEPYMLVFSESFHSGWRLYMDNMKRERMTLMGVLGKVAREITGLFLDDKGYGEDVASYFDGEIKEGTHRMTFLEPATFETWGKKSIVEDRHFLVNGYANSWYITPEDVGGKENYELIVEFWPQRLFYIELFVSGMTLVGCLGYLGYDFTRKRISS